MVALPGGAAQGSLLIAKARSSRARHFVPGAKCCIVFLAVTLLGMNGSFENSPTSAAVAATEVKAPRVCPPGTVLDALDGRCAYHVGLIFPYGEFLQTAVVGVYLAIEHINSRNSTVVPQAEMLPPGFKVAPLLLDSHFSPAGGVNAGIEARNAGVIAVVGAARSSASIPLSHVMVTSQTPVVSYASTSATLSSTETFPYFARTIPTDTDVSTSLANLMIRDFDWRRLGILYVDDNYGSSFYIQFVAACRTKALSMGLNGQDYEVRGEAISEGFAEAALIRMRDAGYRVFALVLLGDYMPLFLRAATKLGMIGKGYTYITMDSDIADTVKSPESYGIEADEAEVFNEHLQGMLRMYLDPLKEPQYSILDQAAAEIGPTIVPEQFKAALAAQGADMDSWFDQGLQREIYASYAYDAMWSIALALSKAEQEVDGWLKEDLHHGAYVNRHGPELMHLIRSGSFRGASGLVQFNSRVDDNGDRTFIGDRDSSLMELPLQFYNSTLREWVTAGVISPDGLVLQRAVEWPGLLVDIPTDGASCEAGWYFDSSSLTCVKCKPGWFSMTSGQSQCQPCQPGTYCGKAGCKTCDACAINTFQASSNATSCNLCPSNTANGGRGMSSLESCMCRPGSYRRDGKPGRMCFDCPEGGVCQGESQSPCAAQGFWGDWGLVDLSEEDSDKAAHAIHRSSFHACTNKAYCTSNWTEAEYGSFLEEVEDPLGLVDPNDRSAEDELMHLVRSDPSRQCSVETRGRMCSTCSLNYYSLGGKCLPCMKPYALFVVGCILAVFAVWYMINRIAAGQYEAVDLMLLYFQNASTISTYSLNWHPWLVAGPFWLLSIVNFDVDFFKPDCLSTASFSAWSFGHSLVTQLMLPVLVVFFCSASYFLGRVCTSFISSTTKHRLSSNTGSARARSGMSGATDVMLSPPTWVLAMRYLGIATTDQELEKAYDNSIGTSTSFCCVIYHTLTLKCLEVFLTKGLPDQSHFVVADPSLSTDTAIYKVYVAVSVVGLLVYTIGFPVYIFFVLEYGRVHNLFRDERFSRRYGWLYLRYERDWYYWELVILARRLGLVLVILATAVPSLQIWFGLTVIVATMTMHFYARPFINDSLDMLETASLVSLIGFLMTGILFCDKEAPMQFEHWDQAVVILVCFFLFGALIMVTAMVVNDIRNEEVRKRVARSLQQDIQQVLDLYSPENYGGCSRRRKRKIIDRVSETLLGSFTPRSSDGSFSAGLRLMIEPRASGDLSLATDAQHSIPDMRKIMKYKINSARLMEEDLEIHRTLDVHKIDRWLCAQTQANSSVGKSSKVHQQPPDLEQARGGSGEKSNLSVSFADASYGEEIMPKSHQLAVLRLWLLNHWMRELMSDTSPVSYFSHGSHSQFFGYLVDENPFVIDYLLSLPPDKLDRARETLKELRKAQLEHTKSGRMAGLIAQVDRGPMLAWLMVAPHRNINILKELLEEMLEVDGDSTKTKQTTDKNCPDVPAASTQQKSKPIPGMFGRIISCIMPDPKRLGIRNHPTDNIHGNEEEEEEKQEVKSPATLFKGLSNRCPITKAGGERWHALIAATRTNQGKDLPGFISTMDAQITKLGKFNSDLSKFLEGITGRITGESSESTAFIDWQLPGSFRRSNRGRRSSYTEGQSCQQASMSIGPHHGIRATRSLRGVTLPRISDSAEHMPYSSHQEGSSGLKQARSREEAEEKVKEEEQQQEEEGEEEAACLPACSAAEILPSSPKNGKLPPLLPHTVLEGSGIGPSSSASPDDVGNSSELIPGLYR